MMAIPACKLYATYLESAAGYPTKFGALKTAGEKRRLSQPRREDSFEIYPILGHDIEPFLKVGTP